MSLFSDALTKSARKILAGHRTASGYTEHSTDDSLSVTSLGEGKHLGDTPHHSVYGYVDSVQPPHVSNTRVDDLWEEQRSCILRLLRQPLIPKVTAANLSDSSQRLSLSLGSHIASTALSNGEINQSMFTSSNQTRREATSSVQVMIEILGKNLDFTETISSLISCCHKYPTTFQATFVEILRFMGYICQFDEPFQRMKVATGSDTAQLRILIQLLSFHYISNRFSEDIAALHDGSDGNFCKEVIAKCDSYCQEKGLSLPAFKEHYWFEKFRYNAPTSQLAVLDMFSHFVFSYEQHIYTRLHKAVAKRTGGENFRNPGSILPNNISLYLLIYLLLKAGKYCALIFVLSSYSETIAESGSYYLLEAMIAYGKMMDAFSCAYAQLDLIDASTVGAILKMSVFFRNILRSAAFQEESTKMSRVTADIYLPRLYSLFTKEGFVLSHTASVTIEEVCRARVNGTGQGWHRISGGSVSTLSEHILESELEFERITFADTMFKNQMQAVFYVDTPEQSLVAAERYHSLLPRKDTISVPSLLLCAAFNNILNCHYSYAINLLKLRAETVPEALVVYMVFNRYVKNIIRISDISVASVPVQTEHQKLLRQIAGYSVEMNIPSLYTAHTVAFECDKHLLLEYISPLRYDTVEGADQKHKVFGAERGMINIASVLSAFVLQCGAFARMHDVMSLLTEFPLGVKLSVLGLITSCHVRYDPFLMDVMADCLAGNTYQIELVKLIAGTLAGISGRYADSVSILSVSIMAKNLCNEFVRYCVSEVRIGMTLSNVEECKAFTQTIFEAVLDRNSSLSKRVMQMEEDCYDTQPLTDDKLCLLLAYALYSSKVLLVEAQSHGPGLEKVHLVFQAGKELCVVGLMYGGNYFTDIRAFPVEFAENVLNVMTHVLELSALLANYCEDSISLSEQYSINRDTLLVTVRVYMEYCETFDIKCLEQTDIETLRKIQHSFADLENRIKLSQTRI